jgi:CheY-like chemotaxis protein
MPTFNFSLGLSTFHSLLVCFSHPPETVTRPKVLIVDDNSDVRRLYAIGLNQHGFEVKLASNGMEAIDRIQSERPDVILLDWLMPLMNGGEVLNRLETDHSDGIPIIVISGQPEPPPETRDPRIGFWLTKPVTVDELVHAIHLRAPAAQVG